MTYTINENAVDIWVRDNADTMDLSVQADASSIYLENGRTMEQEFGKGAMSSNIATVDSDMEKVIDGTYDGAYESCKMYGRTLKSLFTRAFSLNPNVMYSQISGHHDDVQIEVGKEYTVIIDVYKNNSNCSLGFKTYGCTITPRDGLGFQGREIGRKIAKVVFTTKEFGRWFWFETNIADENATEPIECELTVVDGDYRDTRLDHFGGLCDVKNPILKNVGKNLFNYNDVSQGSIIWNTPNNVNIFQDVWYEELTYGFRLKECIKVKPNTRYYTNFPYNMHVMKYRVNGDLIKNQWSGVDTGYFITTSDTHYINLYPSGGINANLWNEERRQLFRECFIYEEDAISTYENYKTNILTTPEQVVLRKVGDVCDSYDALTGEYVQRVGEVVFDGSEGINLVDSVSNSTYLYFDFKGEFTGAKNDSFAICDRFTYVKGLYGDYQNVEGVAVGENGWGSIRILASKLATPDVIGFKQWLSQNPVTAQYELEVPIITTIEPSTIPFVYENGHIILESGHEGQSLLPTLEYQTVVSRSGQVAMIDKTIQQHERKITLLEKMLVQNIIDIEYKNTLLALKLEIDEVI